MNLSHLAVVSPKREAVTMSDVQDPNRLLAQVEPFDPTKSYQETRAVFETAFERRYVSWLLTRHDGNLSAAAREARMDRKYLYGLARKLGLRTPRPRRKPVT